jgi:hypothetical protein
MTKRMLVRVGALVSGLVALVVSGGASWSIK